GRYSLAAFSEGRNLLGHAVFEDTNLIGCYTSDGLTLTVCDTEGQDDHLHAGSKNGVGVVLSEQNGVDEDKSENIPHENMPLRTRSLASAGTKPQRKGAANGVFKAPGVPEAAEDPAAVPAGTPAEDPVEDPAGFAARNPAEDPAAIPAGLPVELPG